MGSKYRTLSLNMSCGDGRIRKKRLKNLCNPFCMCHQKSICLQCRERDVDDESSEKFALNNEYSEITNNKKINRLASTFAERSISEQKHQTTKHNVKMRPCKKFYSFTFTTFMMPLLIISLLNHVQIIQAFNLDIGTRVVFSQPPSTMFGFSVAGHKEGNVGW